MSQLRDALARVGVFQHPEPADPRLRGSIDPDGLRALREYYLLQITLEALSLHGSPDRPSMLREAFPTIKGKVTLRWYVNAVDGNPYVALDLLDEEIPMP
jgi:hypothetical protein